MKAALLVCGLMAACFGSSALAQSNYGERRFNDIDEEEWREQDIPLPAFPRDENLIEFKVGNLATNRFFIDANSLTVGDKDRIVRFTLVVRTSGGATNISYQGMHCNKLRWKTYANGRADGTWVTARYGSEWKEIENKPVNRHHAELFRYFFCPRGVAIMNTAEGIDALRRGHHPLTEGPP